MATNGFGRGSYRGANQHGSYHNQNGHNHSNGYPDVGNLSLNDQPASRGGPPRPPPGHYDTPEDQGVKTLPQINRNAFNGSSPNGPPPSSGPAWPAKRNVPPPPGFGSSQSVDPRLDAVNRKQSTHSNNSNNGYAVDDPWAGPPPPNGDLHHGENSAPANLDRRYGNQTESYQQNGNFNNRGRGGFNGSHGGHNQEYQDYGERDSRGDSWNGNSHRGDDPRGSYGNDGGYGAHQGGPRDQYAAPNDFYGAPRSDYNAPRGGGGSYNAPRGNYNNSHGGYDNRQPQRGYPSNRHDNYRNPNDYRDDNRRYDNGHGPPMSQNRQSSYESTGSNQSYPRNNFPRTGGNDVPLGNGRFANTNQNTRPPPNFNNGFQGNGRPEVPNRAPRDYVPQDRNVNAIFEEDQKHTVHDNFALMDGDAEIEVKGLAGQEQVRCEQWSDMELHPKIMENIKKSGYTYPRKIQQNTIPYVMDNRDIMCQGETGSGKTAAFLIPAIHKFLHDKENGAWTFTDRPYCLIISPTRELANQLYEQTKKFADNTGIRFERAYGEINMNKNALQVSKCDILIGCVGRLLHFMERGELVAGNVKILIIDEADRLFSGNDNQKFYEMFRHISSREARQTLLFSATLGNAEVKSLASQHMKNDFIEVVAKTQSNSRIRYLVYPVEHQPKKFELLTQYLRHIKSNNNEAKCLIFVNTKLKVDQVAVDLAEIGIKAITIHGDRSQDLREEALSAFRSGHTPVLVATDVCARGVDVYEMDYVVNMDLPNDIAVFVQRCGRTGRLQEGEAVSFYHEPTDQSIGINIAEVIENSQQVVPPFLRNGVTPSDYGSMNNYRDAQRQPGRSTPPRDSPRPRASPTNGQGSSAAVIPDQSVNDDW